MPMVSGPDGVLINAPTGGGLLSAFDPDAQAQQQQLKQAQAFKDGVPRDADGNPDYDAMATKLMQLGSYGDASKLMTTGIEMQGMRAAQKAASDPLLTGGGAPVAGGGAPGGSVAGQSGNDPMNAYAHSIGSMESSNKYDALGPQQKNGDRAYGRFQVMGANVGPWTKEVLGQAMSPEDFLANPQAQDAVFRAKFGQSVQQYGNPMDAASVWFSGKPLNRAGNASDSLGTTVPAYVRKFAAGLGSAPPASALAQSAAAAPPTALPAAASAQPAPAAGRPAAAAGTLGALDPNSSTRPDGVVTDRQYQAALTAQTQAANMDPRQMTPQAQNAATLATAMVERYRQQQAAPPAGVAANGAPVASSTSRGAPPPDVMAAITRMKGGQGTPDDKALWQSWASSGQANGGTAADSDAPVSNVHPLLSVSPSSNPARGGGAAGSASPIGAVQPVSFSGTPAANAGPIPPQPQAGGAVPPGRQPPPGVAAAPAQPMPQNGGAPGLQPPARLLPAQGSASMMVDPTMNGLLRGQWVGNPGGYALALRSRAAAYSANPYTKGTGEQFAALANQIDQGIARESLITPEMKNYAVARQQGFAGSMMDFHVAEAKAQADAQNASRLASDTDPSRLGFAGQQAAATAAGTAAGQNTPAAVAGRAANAGAVAEAEGQGKYLGGLPAAYAKQADAARATSDNVDQMLNAAQGFRMGAGAELQQDARKALQGTLGFLGVSDPKLNDPTASYEDFGKMAGVLNRNAAQQVGGRTGVQEMQLIGSTLPSPEMSYDGFRSVASSLKGSADYTIAKQQAAQDWVSDPAHRNSLAGFEATFNRNTSPAAFWLNRLRVDQPDLFSRTVQGLARTDQGRALLGKAKAGMGWANSNGLFN